MTEDRHVDRALDTMSKAIAYALERTQIGSAAEQGVEKIQEAFGLLQVALTQPSTPARPVPPDLAPGLRRAVEIVQATRHSSEEEAARDRCLNIAEFLRAELAAQAERGEEQDHG